MWVNQTVQKDDPMVAEFLRWQETKFRSGKLQQKIEGMGMKYDKNLDMEDEKS